MKIQKTVLTETKHVALGVLIGDVVMCAVFAILKKFDYTVVLGALLGSAAAIGNFFLLGLSLQKGLELGDGLKSYMKTSYAWRTLLQLVCIALGALLPCFNTVAAIVPLFLPRVTILVMQLTGLYKPEKTNAEKGDEQP